MRCGAPSRSEDEALGEHQARRAEQTGVLVERGQQHLDGVAHVRERPGGHPLRDQRAQDLAASGGVEGFRTDQAEPGGLLAHTPDGIGIVAGGNARIFGPFRWDDGLDNGIQDGVDYYCKTAPSRDSYAGTLYGLPYADDLVGKDDPALREQIRGDVLVLAGRLVKYGFSFPRPHGNVSRGPRPRRPPSR